jgi:2-keto-3-deoxy-L-rhamnonate aldolase RhmA
MSTLRSLLQTKELIVGLTTQHVTAPWLAKLWRRSGADFVYVEYEHGFFNEADLAAFVLSCRSEGLPVVAKVPECIRTAVAKLLECGVTGIQLPWSESREQIDRLVSYMKFPPLGIRALCTGTGNSDYDLGIEARAFIEQANVDTVALAHIETRTGVENIEAILGNPHVDIVFLGMADLSVSYGHPLELSHPDIVRAAERVCSAARQAGKVVGMWVPDAEKARRWMGNGVRFFETSSEVDLIDSGARHLIAQFRTSATAAV